MQELHFFLTPAQLLELARLESICRCITVKGGQPDAPCSNENCVRCRLNVIVQDAKAYTQAINQAVALPSDYARQGDGVGRREPSSDVEQPNTRRETGVQIIDERHARIREAYQRIADEGPQAHS